MKTLKIWALGAALLTAASCGSLGTGLGDGSTSDQTLNMDLGGKWKLTAIHETADKTISEAFPNKKPTLQMEAVTRKFTGNTGCNQIFGSFTTKQNQVTFGNIGGTRMYCEGVDENLFLDALKQTRTYKISGKKLILVDNGGTELLTFSK